MALSQRQTDDLGKVVKVGRVAVCVCVCVWAYVCVCVCVWVAGYSFKCGSNRNKWFSKGAGNNQFLRFFLCVRKHAPTFIITIQSKKVNTSKNEFLF